MITLLREVINQPLIKEIVEFKKDLMEFLEQDFGNLYVIWTLLFIYIHQ